MFDLSELKKAVASGEKTIIVPEGAGDWDLPAIVDCIKGAHGITLDLSETKITNIGKEAFKSCDALKAIILPKGLTSIWNSAFEECKALSQVTIPRGVTSIGNHAFDSCFKLTQVEIPVSVTSIGKYAFHKCNSLWKVVIPESVTSIEPSAFYWCHDLAKIDVASGNKNYSSVGGVLFSKDKKTLVRYPEGQTAEYYEIPEGITSIGKSAFYCCKSLTKVVIPESVTSIEDHAFCNCTVLTRIEIPASVTSIGYRAFYRCESLKVTIPSSVTSIGYEAFKGCSAALYKKLIYPHKTGLMQYCVFQNAVSSACYKTQYEH